MGGVMRQTAMIFAIALSAGSAFANTQAADACKATLSPAGQQLYEATMAKNPTKETARGIITKEVEQQISDGKVSMSEGRKEGEAVGECLKKLE